MDVLGVPESGDDKKEEPPKLLAGPDAVEEKAATNGVVKEEAPETNGDVEHEDAEGDEDNMDTSEAPKEKTVNEEDSADVEMAETEAEPEAAS